MVLQKLAPLEQDTIKACLEQDSAKWELLAVQSTNLEEIKGESLDSEQLRNFYETQTAGLQERVPLEELLELSSAMAKDVPEYRHSEFQAAIAGVALS